MVTKLIFAGLLPAVAVAGLIVLIRGWRSVQLRTALASVGTPGAAIAAIAAPHLGWAVLSGRGVAFGHPGPLAPVTSARETFT